MRFRKIEGEHLSLALEKPQAVLTACDGSEHSLQNVSLYAKCAAPLCICSRLPSLSLLNKLSPPAQHRLKDTRRRYLSSGKATSSCLDLELSKLDFLSNCFPYMHLRLCCLWTCRRLPLVSLIRMSYVPTTRQRSCALAGSIILFPAESQYIDTDRPPPVRSTMGYLELKCMASLASQ
jgi:hypothetical protein